MTLTVGMPALGDPTQVPLVAKEHVALSETQTLNPQPIPPGKPTAAVRAKKKNGDQRVVTAGRTV